MNKIVPRIEPDPPLWMQLMAAQKMHSSNVTLFPSLVVSALLLTDLLTNVSA